MHSPSPDYFSQVEDFGNDVLSSFPMPGDLYTLSDELGTSNLQGGTGSINTNTVHLSGLYEYLFGSCI